MSYVYILHEYAQKDYEASLKWYNERSLQAAENFVAAVDYALVLICNYPTRWRNKHKNFYELSLKKYPFTIIYTIEEDIQTVVVSAIYHQKRNPASKCRRLR